MQVAWMAGEWGDRWSWLGASHPPPNLPPGRGEGPERGEGGLGDGV